MILRIAGAAIFIGAAAAAERLLERGHRKKRASLAHVPPEVSQALNGNERLFDNQELELLIMLVEEGNRHLFEDWPPPGRDDDQKKHFARKVVQLDAGYAEGGLRGYIMNARRLLKDSLQGKNAFEGYTPGVPTGISLDYGSEEFQQLEALGVAEAAAAGFVLVAGGLGERLGYSGIKLALPSESARGASFLQLFIESILALQQRGSAAAGGEAPRKLPLAIMTSDDTHCRTAALLEKHSFFGMQPDQVVLMKQEKVACLQDNDARLALANGKKYDLMTKPHGHGDVHALLWSRGIAERWQQQGVRWVCFFQDTNGLVFRALPAALGVSAREGYDMNSLAVPRRAKEAIGAITQLVSKDGSRSMTVNVEYNQLDPLLCACGWKKGDMNEARTGYSPFPGNINQLVLKLEPYLQQLKLTRGIIVEFVNPKYKDAAKSTFKSPTRLECMMQDYPKDLPPTARVGFTVVKQVWAGYSPVKNSPADALAKANSGNPTHSATTGEVDIYNAQAKSLKMVGVNVGSATSATFNGLSVDMLPRVVLSPSFACSLRELRTKIGRGGASRTGWSAAFSSGRNDVKLSTDSVLVVEGPNISIRKLSVSGALVVRAVPGAHVEIDGLAVVNRGWSWKPLQEGEDAPEELKIRGFRVERSETCLLEFLTPGSYRPRGVIQGDVHEVMEKGRYSNTDLISP